MADNFRFAQLQPFALTGSGASIGDTSIILQSMTDIDGNALSMSGTFGAKGFGTLEPGNGALEEQIVFTGLTNNTNGTVTLSGVSTVDFVYPYTETSGLAKTHAGNTSFVISNTSGYYNQFVAKDDDGTISEVLTFTVPNYPQVDDANTPPTTNAQFATKKYVDDTAFNGAPDATTSVKGIIQLPTQAQVDAKTALGSTGASLVVTPATQRSTLLSDYVADTGTADAYAIAPSPAISAYAAGQQFTFTAAHTNTTTSTLNVNTLGAKTINKLDGATALVANDIVAGQIITVEYDGTNFQMLNPSAAGSPTKIADYQSFTSSGTWTKPTGLTGDEEVTIQAWGGGGGGGSATSTSSPANAGGGGGGAFFQWICRASDLSPTETVTIGAGGSAGSAGGNTTFGSHLTAYGGGAGTSATNGQTTGGGGGGGTLGIGGNSSASSTAGTGGEPVAGSGLTATFGGGLGNSGKSIYGGGTGGLGANTGTAGVGGNSIYGGGGGGGGGGAVIGVGGTSMYGGAGGAGTATVGGTGVAGSAPGGGGGGSGSNNTNAGTETGGAGARGECRVWVTRNIIST